jgi:hypothetical protein
LTDCENGSNRRNTDAGAEFKLAKHERGDECQRDTRRYSSPSRAPLAKHESRNGGQRRQDKNVKHDNPRSPRQGALETSVR